MEDRYLFRAKRIDNVEWEIGSLVCLPNGEYEIANKCTNPPDSDPMWGKCVITHKVDHTTICQCTGLTDKNGQKIWENDIVDYLGRKGKVKYECGSFGIVFREIIDWEEIEANICPITGCDNSLYACENDNFISLWEIMWNFNDIENSIETIEVIGNIFDNPELLESEE